MIFRDDDVRKDTDVKIIESIHNIYLKYDRIHTLGLILEDIYDTPVWYWMVETYKNTPKHISFGLHAWIHRDYSILTYNECIDDLSKCINYWNKYRADMPEFKVFFPPNSKTSGQLIKACEDLGLICLNYGVHYPMYIFHWGELTVEENCNRLEQVLVKNIGEGY